MNNKADLKQIVKECQLKKKKQNKTEKALPHHDAYYRKYLLLSASEAGDLSRLCLTAEAR